MAVNVTPLHDRVMVKRIEEKESVKGGIIIPDSAKEKPQEGEVIAVGAGKRRKGRAHSAGRRSRRSHPVRQVQRHRNQDRRRRIPDPPRRRNSGEARRRSQSRQEVTQFGDTRGSGFTPQCRCRRLGKQAQDSISINETTRIQEERQKWQSKS